MLRSSHVHDPDIKLQKKRLIKHNSEHCSGTDASFRRTYFQFNIIFLKLRSTYQHSRNKISTAVHGTALARRSVREIRGNGTRQLTTHRQQTFCNVDSLNALLHRAA